jgi:plasmid stability protein
MADVLVRDIDTDVLEALKGRARQRGRSLQAELKTILEQAAQVDMTDARTIAARIRRSLRNGKYSDSASLLARDRAR